MSNHFSPCFWGASDEEAFLEDFRKLVERHFGHMPIGMFAGDNLIAMSRNLAFLDDEAFMSAFRQTVTPENTVGMGIAWRIYIFCWAAESSLKREGDFVECGVSSGTSSKIMCDYVNLNNYNKLLFLYDTFGVNKHFDATIYFSGKKSILDEITSRFSAYQGVRIVPGLIPDSFTEAMAEKIAFLHIDLNNVDAEIASLEAMFDRVVPGGIVLFDDYGAAGYTAQKVAEDNWCGQRGYKIAELPTGQGLLIK